jgi:hypothetical protein
LGLLHSYDGLRVCHFTIHEGQKLALGSFAPKPSRGAGRLGPEFSKTEHNAKHRWPNVMCQLRTNAPQQEAALLNYFVGEREQFIGDR